MDDVISRLTRVGVDHLGLVARLQVPEDGGVVEEGQVHHVLALLKLGRVHLQSFFRRLELLFRVVAHPSNFLLLVGELLVADSDDQLGRQVGVLGADRGNLSPGDEKTLPVIEMRLDGMRLDGME